MNGLLWADLNENNNINRFKARRDWKHRVESGRNRKAGTEEGVQARSRSLPSVSVSAPSRRDPMPTFFVVSLALLTLLAIGQFLQRIWGG